MHVSFKTLSTVFPAELTLTFSDNLINFSNYLQKNKGMLWGEKLVFGIIFGKYLLNAIFDIFAEIVVFEQKCEKSLGCSDKQIWHIGTYLSYFFVGTGSTCIFLRYIVIFVIFILGIRKCQKKVGGGGGVISPGKRENSKKPAETPSRGKKCIFVPS